MGVVLTDGFIVEQVVELVVGHSAACIGNRYLHVVGGLGCIDVHIALGSKLPGIVGQGVDHEEGENAVGLDDGIGRLDT